MINWLDIAGREDFEAEFLRELAATKSMFREQAPKLSEEEKEEVRDKIEEAADFFRRVVRGFEDLSAVFE